MIKIYNIYVSTNGSLLHQINIHWCNKNILNYMLGHHDFKNLSNVTYKREQYMQFMLTNGVYINRSLN